MSKQLSFATIRWLSFLLCACHSEARPPSPPPSPSACPAGQSQDGRRCVSAASPPTPSVAPTPPVPASPADAERAVLGPRESAVLLDAVGAQAASAVVDAIAATRLGGGVRPVGKVLAGHFTTGQVLERDFEAMPGRCYSVVGAGLPPVTEVELKLVPTLALPSGQTVVLAEDKTKGAEAVLGEPPHCFRWAAPPAATLRVVLQVGQGQGVAAARVYER